VKLYLHREPGLLSRYSDSLRAGSFWDRIPVQARFSALVHIGPWAHRTSCTMGLFSGVKRPKCDIDHPHTHTSSAKVKKNRAIPVLRLLAFIASSRANSTIYISGQLQVFRERVGTYLPPIYNRSAQRCVPQSRFESGTFQTQSNSAGHTNPRSQAASLQTTPICNFFYCMITPRRGVWGSHMCRMLNILSPFSDWIIFFWQKAIFYINVRC
jgi:hypothetical protein